ncbi:MAG TPA: hypothetical protein VJ756_12210 [Terriglobales bacterium]|nr:hypothetical protein [Terriglobales bacterium]
MRVGRFMIVTMLLALSMALLAQVPNLHPQQTFTPEPIVSFSLELAGAVPPYYSISVESTGNAAYRSSPIPGDMEGDPYITKFVVSQAARTSIFDLAKKLHYFKGDYEYHKGRLANTGAKTLYYTDEKTNNSTTYNYSSNQEIQELTKLFQGISTTLEFGRRLQYYYDHQKLGLDDELKRMDQMAQEGQLDELQAVSPILRKIADDPQVMHIDKQHAQHLLQLASASPRQR